MAADLKKWRVPFFSKCRNSGNNGRNCTIFGAQGDLGRPFDLLYFDLGVTSHDIFVTFTVFQKLWRKWTLAQNLLGLELLGLGFDLGVTSRDLSMTLTVLNKIWRKPTLPPKLLGLEWCNLGKS